MSSAYSKELNVQNASYFMVIPSRSEKRYSLICFGNWYTRRFFDIIYAEFENSRTYFLFVFENVTGFLKLSSAMLHR